MRALEPLLGGKVHNPNDGVGVYFEEFRSAKHAAAANSPTIVFLPTWSLVHSRVWKMQVPFFAHRGYRVIAFDGRGNGHSDRPKTGYTTADFTADALAVLDHLEVDRAAVVAFSAGSRWGIQLAAERPERVSHLALVAPAASLAGAPRVLLAPFLEEPPDREGWNKYNAVHWREDYWDFVEWFAGRIFTEPHSTKGRDDICEWANSTAPAMLTQTVLDSATRGMAELWANVKCPTLLMHGDDDQVIPLDNSRAFQAARPSTELLVFEGGGHAPHIRDAVKANLDLAEFIERDVQPAVSPAQRTWRRAMARREKRALFVSSPIGLGHAQRDLAIARELRGLVPGLRIDWLAQHPVTRLLEAGGENIHPASAWLAGESPHIESLMGADHELNVFQAIREMDEILLANFHVFHDVAKAGDYDLWVGDEAWEVDYYLHENPELKSAPFAWLTDFVGYLPMVGGENGREAFVTSDYNAEMIYQVARFRRVRDASIYIGDADDIVPDAFGPGLPKIKDWLAENFDHNGYIRYFDPSALGEREALRSEFGFGPGERVAVAAVGGTSVGMSLLKRVVASFPAARGAVPDLRLVVVCGPRIDPTLLPRIAGVEYLGYVHDLYRMLAAADVALVQGGLSTTMELVAAGTPFLYFPLTNHFEQNRHVAHRLERYGVPDWTRVPFSETGGDWLADKLTRLLHTPPRYRPVEGGGARRAAEKIAALL